MSTGGASACPDCGFENPEGSRFCGSCGRGLAEAQPCPSCGAENPAGQSFCNSCGAGLTAADAAEGPATGSDPLPSDGERKQVTVLFADVQGSMDMAERSDPEEWRSIMQRFFSLLSDGVHRFEGTVDKFTGDGIMALFGAPVAYEDHAQRACYAALQMAEEISEYATELRRSNGLNFSVRIGINSGEVVAGSIGDAGELEYTAVGHTVGLAQRMESLAEPGKAYLTEHAAKLAEGYLELKDLGEFEVKGASRPIGVFELVGPGSVRTRLDLSEERGFTRFVGRAQEMEVLEEALEATKAGKGAVVGVVAEPGIGKSRLCHEFAERCRDRGVDVYETQGQAHGGAIPLMPVLQMLRGYFGIEDRDSDRQAREKIAGRMLLLDPEFADDLPLVFDFLAVPDPERPAPQISGEARLRALRGIVRHLYRAPGRKDVVVNVVEDLHWLDEASDVFVGEMAEALEGTPTLALLNFRPEYEAEWTGSAIYRSIPLVPLGPEAARELFVDLAGEDPSLDGLSELICERTGGNPFFIEEVVRELAESGLLEGERGAYALAGPIDEIRVPASVQSILAARIDRLPAPVKRVLQVASVIGKEPSESALAMVAGMEETALDAAIRELIQAGFLYEAELYPERVLAFRHPLTQEVAFGSQLTEQRTAAHAATAEALIELEPERHDEHAALISQHLAEGGETLKAAGWAARAAHRAGHSHPEDAMRLWTRVSELADELPESEEKATLAVTSRLLQLDFAWRLGMEHERLETMMEETREMAGRIDNAWALAMLELMAPVRPGAEHDAETWTRHADEAIVQADRSGDDSLRVAVRVASSYCHVCTGAFDQAERLWEEVDEIAGDDRGMGVGIVLGCPIAWMTMARGIVARERNRFQEALELTEQSLRIATEYEDVETEGWARGNKVVLLDLMGEQEEALALAHRNYELTERIGDVFSRTWAIYTLGAARVMQGEFAEGLETLETAEQLYRDAMGRGGEAQGWRASYRAEALIGLERFGEALAAAEEAIEASRGRGLHWPEGRALRMLALARAANGDPGVDEAFDEAIELCRGLGLTRELEAIEEDRAGVAAGSP